LLYILAHGCPELDKQCKVMLESTQETFSSGLEDAAETYWEYLEEEEEEAEKKATSPKSMTREEMHFAGLRIKSDAQVDKIESLFEEFDSYIQEGFDEENPPQALSKSDPMSHVFFIYYIDSRKKWAGHEEDQDWRVIPAYALPDIRRKTIYNFTHPIAVSQKFAGASAAMPNSTKGQGRSLVKPQDSLQPPLSPLSTGITGTMLTPRGLDSAEVFTPPGADGYYDHDYEYDFGQETPRGVEREQNALASVRRDPV